jgi:hypothetical protein
MILQMSHFGNITPSGYFDKLSFGPFGSIDIFIGKKISSRSYSPGSRADCARIKFKFQSFKSAKLSGRLVKVETEKASQREWNLKKSTAED